ncbi:MAG: 4-hydroxy-tetrahydrodipicolinate reductase [Acholeplasmataceae bacterium]
MKVIIYGSQGTMGQLASSFFRIKNIDVIEVDVMSKKDGVITNINDIDDADVIIDFSHVSQIDTLLTYAQKKHKPLLIATTGYSPEQEAKIRRASLEIPIFKSANLSLGIHLMRLILKDYTKILEAYYDIEIIEKHHKNKVDAPSGTALMLFETLKEASKNELNLVTNRSDLHEKKDTNDVGIASIRAGQIVGEHTLLFASDEDVIELTHKAQSKIMFVKGAWVAANFIVNQNPGYYTMDDIPLERMKNHVNS